MAKCPKCKAEYHPKYYWCDTCRHSLVTDPDNLSPSEQVRFNRESNMGWEERSLDYRLSILNQVMAESRDGKESKVVEKRYPALRAIAGTLQLFASLVIVAGILIVIIATIAAGIIGLFISAIMGSIFFGLLWAGLKSYSELIYVQIDIEQNTRTCVQLLANPIGKI